MTVVVKEVEVVVKVEVVKVEVVVNRGVGGEVVWTEELVVRWYGQRR